MCYIESVTTYGTTAVALNRRIDTIHKTNSIKKNNIYQTIETSQNKQNNIHFKQTTTTNYFKMNFSQSNLKSNQRKYMSQIYQPFYIRYKCRTSYTYTHAYSELIMPSNIGVLVQLSQISQFRYVVVCNKPFAYIHIWSFV